MSKALRQGAGSRWLEKWARVLASDRRGFVIAFVLVLTFNLYWYGAFLSFPLFGEDSGALYSNLLEMIRDGHLVTTLYPIKWLEGLGQPNLFVSFTFDPFSWLMLLPLEPADAFRLSMALRATVGWAASCWFVLVLFRGRRDIALAAATLYLLINFILMSASGIPTYAGMYNATHAAIFPLLPALALIIMRSRRWLGPADVGFLAALLFFVLVYPIGCLIGLAVFVAFAGIAFLLARRAERGTAFRGLVKIAAIAAVVLLAPPLDALASWSSLVRDSARAVYSDELFAYGNSHQLPLMWAGTPWALRACVVLGLAVVLFNRAWPRPLHMAGATLAAIVGGVQLAGLAEYLGLDGGLIGRLPRLHYFEFYSPLFYAACGGFALQYWRDLIFPRFEGRRALRWAGGAALLMVAAAVALPLAALVVASYGLIAAAARVRGEPRDSPWMRVAPWRRLFACGALLALMAAAVGAWLPPSAEIYPIFYAYARCRSGVLWCRDAAGATMGMMANPITGYLRQELGGDGNFRGRAETLVRPPVRFERLPAGEVRWTFRLYERLLGWYSRAYDDLAIKYSPTNNPLWLPPRDMTWLARWPLLVALDKFGRNDVPYYGPSQESLIVEMHDWYREYGAGSGLVASDLLDPYGGERSVEAVVGERNQAFFMTGNGLVQRALPFQGVPVASSYEQGLGYLYYLLWTRYLSAGEAAQKSINMTSLETLHPERLALVGVRYVVARDSEVYEPPPLKRVMSWHGYSVSAVPDANLAGYAVREVAYGATLADELRLMRRHGFEPRRTAVLPVGARGTLGEGALSGVARASLRLAADAVVFKAASAERGSLVVLPVNWSHCWVAEWRQGHGRVMRADVGLVGVAFSGAVELRLIWRGGYGSARECLYEDEELVDEARAAAAAVGFAEAYERIDEHMSPFAAARPRFAVDAVEEAVLERTAMYQSGDEVVVPAAVKGLLTADELAGEGWTRAVAAELRREGKGYALNARNDGGVSLEVLPLLYSACWQGAWQGSPGTLVPVDGRWLGILFRGEVALRLSRAEEGTSAACEAEDRARARLAALLREGGGGLIGGHYTLGDTIAFRAGGGSEVYTTRGWWAAEPWGRWSVGKDARLVLRLAAPVTQDLVLEARVGALLAGPRQTVRAEVSVNGTAVGSWEFHPDNTPGERTLAIPSALVAGTDVLVLGFRVDNAVSPKALGLGADWRELALGFRALTVKAAGIP